MPKGGSSAGLGGVRSALVEIEPRCSISSNAGSHTLAFGLQLTAKVDGLSPRSRIDR